MSRKKKTENADGSFTETETDETETDETETDEPEIVVEESAPPATPPPAPTPRARIETAPPLPPPPAAPAPAVMTSYDEQCIEQRRHRAKCLCTGDARQPIDPNKPIVLPHKHKFSR